MLKEFIIWEETIRPEIEHIHSILSKKLSDEPEMLISDLKDAEVWNSRMGALLAQADSWLDRYTLIAMPSKTEDRTEADRKALVESETSPIRLMRDTIENITESIKQRLILGESVLSYLKAQYIDQKSKSNNESIY